METVYQRKPLECLKNALTTIIVPTINLKKHLYIHLFQFFIAQHNNKYLENSKEEKSIWTETSKTIYPNGLNRDPNILGLFTP